MTRVAVVGATGYAGAELVRILAGHPHVQLTVLTSRQYQGVAFDQIYPALTGVVSLTCEAYAVERVCDQADVVFTALPHKLPMDLVPDLLRHGKKVIDLSADFRFESRQQYEAHYQPHAAAALLPEAVYGLSEVYTDRIQQAHLVGNPGCYPTSALLPLVPLIKTDLIDRHGIVVDAKSGVSGAGRTPALTTLFSEVNESFKAYKVAEHRHTPEMEEVLTREAGAAIRLTFVPHLVPMTRGMQTTLYATLLQDTTAVEVRRLLRRYYQGRTFVRILEDARVPDVLHVKGTNFCDIGVRIDVRTRRLILLSAIDNLVKGAAGQAVQNMNLMLGLEETAGLMGVPYPL